MKRRRLASPVRPKSSIDGLRRSSRRSCRVFRRADLRPLDRQTSADRSRMGIRRAGWLGRRGICVGQHVRAERRLHGKHLARRISATKFCRRRLPAHIACRGISRRMATGVHDMIGNVWSGLATGIRPSYNADVANAYFIPQNPRGGTRNRQPRSAPAEHQDSAQSHQGWLAFVRPELLPALSARGTPCRSCRRLD